MLFELLFEALVVVRAHFSEIDGRVLQNMQFGALVQVRAVSGSCCWRCGRSFARLMAMC